MFLIILLYSAFLHHPPGPPPAKDGLFFHFKGRDFHLTKGMQRGPDSYLPKGDYDNDKLDTLSNWYNPGKKYVEIIRQDNASRPTVGVALGFEFDEQNGEYPYTPAFAVLQLKDFAWGGVEFSKMDTCNYTGVSNDISDDLQIEIEAYRNDTIFGNFSGLLINGAERMSALENGHFAIKLYRVQ